MKRILPRTSGNRWSLPAKNSTIWLSWVSLRDKVRKPLTDYAGMTPG